MTRKFGEAFQKMLKKGNIEEGKIKRKIKILARGKNLSEIYFNFPSSN